MLLLPSGVGLGQEEDFDGSGIGLVMLNDNEQGVIDEQLNRLREGLRTGDTSVLSLAIPLLRDDRGFQRQGYSGRDSVEVWREVRSLLLSFGDITGAQGLMDESGRAMANYLQENIGVLKYSSLLGKFTDVPVEEGKTVYHVH